MKQLYAKVTARHMAAASLLLLVSFAVAQEQEELPAEAVAAAKEGALAFAEQNWEAARDAFTKMRATAPNHPAPLVNLATAEYRLGNKEAAQQLIEEAIQLDSRSARAWFLSGILAHETGRENEALAGLAQAVALKPEDSRAHNYLGVVTSKRGWRMAAEAEFRRAVDLDPQYADAHFNLAVTYLQRTPPALELARRHYFLAIDLGAPPDPKIEAALEEEPAS